MALDSEEEDEIKKKKSKIIACHSFNSSVIKFVNKNK